MPVLAEVFIRGSELFIEGQAFPVMGSGRLILFHRMQQGAQVIKLHPNIELIINFTTQRQTFLEYCLCLVIISPMAGNIAQHVEGGDDEAVISPLTTDGQAFL